MTHREVIGDAVLYLGDAREIIASLSKPAAIVSDPPYGQRVNTNVRATTRVRGTTRLSGGDAVPRAVPYPQGLIGDDGPFDPSWLIEAAPIVLLWGAHRFYQHLPANGQMLVWDKLPTGKVKSQGCGEAAWANRAGPLRMFRHLWDGLAVAGGYETRVERKGAAAASRVHPTQKPVDLMRWCIAQLKIPAGGSICDPYMGGGSTGIAAALEGHPFVGCEIEPCYFDAACRRIEAAHQLARDTIAA